MRGPDRMMVISKADIETWTGIVAKAGGIAEPAKEAGRDKNKCCSGAKWMIAPDPASGGNSMRHPRTIGDLVFTGSDVERSRFRSVIFAILIERLSVGSSPRHQHQP